MCCSGGGGDFPSPDEIGQAGARYNRIDQNTPWGSLTYSGPDRNVATQQLSPEMLALQNQMLGLRGGALSQLLARFGGTPANLINPSGTPQYPGAVGKPPANDFLPEEPGLDVQPDFGDKVGILRPGGQVPAGTSPPPLRPTGRVVPNDPAYGGQDPTMTPAYQDINLPYDLGMDDVSFQEDRNRYEQAYMDRARGLLDPMFADKQATLDQQLANRGMPTGTEETELLNRRLGEQQNDAYTKSALDAILAGGSEVRANRGMTLGERLSQFGASSQARSQMFGEDTTEYNQLASILGLTPVQGAGGGMGDFFGPGMVDVNGAYQTSIGAGQAQQGFWGDILGGLLGLGGQLGGAAIGR